MRGLLSAVHLLLLAGLKLIIEFDTFLLELLLQDLDPLNLALHLSLGNHGQSLSFCSLSTIRQTRKKI